MKTKKAISIRMDVEILTQLKAISEREYTTVSRLITDGAYFMAPLPPADDVDKLQRIYMYMREMETFVRRMHIQNPLIVSDILKNLDELEHMVKDWQAACLLPKK